MLILLQADGDLWLKVFSVTMEVKLAEMLTLNVIIELLECCNCIILFLFCAVSSRETAQLYILVLYQLIWNLQYMLHNLIENTATRPVMTVQNWKCAVLPGCGVMRGTQFPTLR